MVTIDLVRKASKRYLFNKMNGLTEKLPKKDIWGSLLPEPPKFPFKFVYKERTQ